MGHFRLDAYTNWNEFFTTNTYFTHAFQDILNTVGCRNNVVQRSCTLSAPQSRRLFAGGHVFLVLNDTYCVLLYVNKTNTRMTVTIGIRLKQHFDTRYFAFCNLSPAMMFLSLDLLSEYRIQHGTIGPPYVTYGYSTWIFYKRVSGFATACPCSVWCRGLNTCLLHVGPLFGNRLLKNSWAQVWHNWLQIFIILLAFWHM